MLETNFWVKFHFWKQLNTIEMEFGKRSISVMYLAKATDKNINGKNYTSILWSWPKNVIPRENQMKENTLKCYFRVVGLWMIFTTHL